MKKEYLTEVVKTSLWWIEAYDEEEARTKAEEMEEADNTTIDSVEILDERYVEDDDDDYYLEEDEETEMEW